MSSTQMQKLENGKVHRWYRFVLAYPDHFVRNTLSRFRLSTEDLVLDPFVGSGTTLVESKLGGIPSIGIDAHPFFVFATRVKTTWNVNPVDVQRERRAVLDDLSDSIVGRGPLELTRREVEKAASEVVYPGLITPEYVSPLPMAKSLHLRDRVDEVEDHQIRDLFRLALASTFVKSANVDFGPEIGLKEPRVDAPVLKLFSEATAGMADDLGSVAGRRSTESHVSIGDARTMDGIEDETVAAVITSPPYPVDKDYTRQIRLESALLGFVTSRADSRQVKERMVRASTRQIYTGDTDQEEVRGLPAVTSLMEEIVRRAKRDGDTSGFVKQYPKLVGEYFGGMKRHLEILYQKIRRDGNAAYVVGDSRSFKMVHIETAKILAEIAERVGFKVEGIELWRDRRSTAHSKPLPENILLLRKQ